MNISYKTTNATPKTNSAMPNQSVMLTTEEIGLETPIAINQAYTVTYNFSTTALSIPGQISELLKFGSTNFGVKFTLIEGDNNIFVTYVSKNPAYVGGYKDYLTTPLPAEWIAAARNHFEFSPNYVSIDNNNTALSTKANINTSSIKTKKYTATFKGVDTAASQEIGSVKFKFRYDTNVTIDPVDPGNDVINPIDVIGRIDSSVNIIDPIGPKSNPIFNNSASSLNK